MKTIDLTYQRWQVAQAIRDGRWHTVEEIAELVGFDPLPCLTTEQNRARNFSKRGTKWQLRPDALRMLEKHETTPREKPKWGKPKRGTR